MSTKNAHQKAATNGVRLRPGTVEDVPAMLRLMDIATNWLVKKGQTGQWGNGTLKHSDNPERIKKAKEFTESGGTWIAVDDNYQSAKEDGGEDDGLAILNGIIGAVAVGPANHYVPKATEPEMYVTFLASDRASSGKGIGTLLLDKVRALAHEAGVSLIRLDCYAGGSGGLVRYYESQGFERKDAFEVKGWPCQILVQRLDPEGQPES